MSNNDMNDPHDPLRSLLRDSRPAPDLPPRFEQGVWRRIEREELTTNQASAVPGWLERLVEVVLQPRWALAGVTAVLLIGGILGASDGFAAARDDARARYVAAINPDFH